MSECKFCEKFDFSRARVKVDDDGAVVEMALCNTVFPIQEQFNFCPVCGKDLKGIAEFEKLIIKATNEQTKAILEMSKALREKNK